MLVQHLALFAATPGLSTLAHALTFALDCSIAGNACNNDCYAVNVAGAQSILTYDQPSANTARSRRRKSGCKQSGSDRSPCAVNQNDPVPPWSNYGNECDEFPYASTREGGTGAILRCVSEQENRNEGGQLVAFYNSQTGCKKQAPCTFDIMITNFGNLQYCNGQTTNQGAEFKKQNGQYVNAKLIKKRAVGDLDGEATFEPHVPDPTLFIHPHERREFLLADGNRTLLLGRGEGKSYHGSQVTHGDGSSSMVVKELFGVEKSLAFQPVAI